MAYELFGRGKESLVFSNTEKDRLIKKEKRRTDEGLENFSSVEKTKAKFYIGRILHILYPKNFPNIHYVQGPHDGNPGFIRVEQIALDEDAEEYRKLMIKYPDLPPYSFPARDRELFQNLQDKVTKKIESNPKHQELQDLIEKFSYLGLDPRINGNFTISAEGDLVYLDSDLLDAWLEHIDQDPEPNFDFKALRQVILENENEAKRKTALRFLERVEHLYEERKSKKKK